MTYAASQVGYWVGQANDNSTGVHPPSGYTPGQRWSTTSSAWQGLYNTEYANARDNSGGAHPTGWVSGQLWSTTAGQWYNMYVTEYNNARDTGGGQSSSGMGAQHPPGWGYGQFYSTTAEQWNAQWGSEWRNARDPQGYPYSYPGQGVNAVFWSQSAAYWRGQADYYWGPSRQWNNGSTWEQNYNAYVGYYNDMVNQRDTWASRANQAWGPSRSWSNGESWEQAYNRVLPAPLSILSTALQVGSSGTGGQWVDIAAITVNRTGYWAGMVHMYFGGGQPSPYGGFVRFRFGGSIGTQQNFNNPAPGATNYGWHTGYDGNGGSVLVGAGTVIACQMNCNTGSGMNGNMWLVFSPTPEYPH